MSPDTDRTPDDVIERENLAENEASLPWTPWISFSATKEEFRQIPKEPGIYRIRPAGKDFLMYIGETKRTLHQRLQDLRMELRNRELMPWSDPHTEGPALWAWQDAESFGYECSATPLDASAASRRGMEQYLLYRYRQEHEQSPLCNFGRFHPRYRSSTTRKENLRGGKLADGQRDNPAGSPTLPPLPVTGTPGKPGWMGISWSRPEILSPESASALAPGPGLFVLFDAASKEIVFIGQSGNCAKRLWEQSRKFPEDKPPEFSVQTGDETILPHQLRERENDLLGNYFERYRKAPEYQFRNNP